MLHFSLPGIIVISFMATLTGLVIVVMLKRIERYTRKEEDDYLKKFGMLLAVLGGLSFILSVSLSVLVYFDFQGKSRLLHPFQVLVTEPARLFIIALFFLGILSFVVGVYTAKRFSSPDESIRKQAEGSSSKHT